MRSRFDQEMEENVDKKLTGIWVSLKVRFNDISLMKARSVGSKKDGRLN